MDKGRSFVVRSGTLDGTDEFQGGTHHVIQINARAAGENGEQQGRAALFERNPALRIRRCGSKRNQRAAKRERSSGKAHEGNLIPGDPAGTKGKRIRVRQPRNLPRSRKAGSPGTVWGGPLRS